MLTSHACQCVPRILSGAPARPRSARPVRSCRSAPRRRATRAAASRLLISAGSRCAGRAGCAQLLMLPGHRRHARHACSRRPACMQHRALLTALGQPPLPPPAPAQDAGWMAGMWEAMQAMHAHWAPSLPPPEAQFEAGDEVLKVGCPRCLSPPASSQQRQRLLVTLAGCSLWQPV